MSILEKAQRNTFNHSINRNVIRTVIVNNENRASAATLKRDWSLILNECLWGCSNLTTTVGLPYGNGLILWTIIALLKITIPSKIPKRAPAVSHVCVAFRKRCSKEWRQATVKEAKTIERGDLLSLQRLNRMLNALHGLDEKVVRLKIRTSEKISKVSMFWKASNLLRKIPALEAALTRRR